jgi:GGDEF domain-containing protein
MVAPDINDDVILSMIDMRPDPASLLQRREYLDYVFNHLSSAQNLATINTDKEGIPPINANKPFTMVFSDMNNLTIINNTMGHIAGDNLIILQGIIMRAGLLGPQSILEDSTLSKFRESIDLVKGMDRFINNLENISDWIDDEDGTPIFSNLVELPPTKPQDILNHNFCGRYGGDEMIGALHGLTPEQIVAACNRIDKITKKINYELKLLEEVDTETMDRTMPDRIHFALGTAWTDGKDIKIIRANPETKVYEIIDPEKGFDKYVSISHLQKIVDREMRLDKEKRGNGGKEKIINDNKLALLGVVMQYAGKRLTADVIHIIIQKLNITVPPEIIFDKLNEERIINE